MSARVSSWEVAQSCFDHTAAEVVAAQLRDAGLPARIVDTGAVPGLEFGSSVLVPAPLLLRARWVLAQSIPSEAELAQLADSSGDADEAA